MTASRYGTATVDDLAQLCAELARDEVVEIMDETKPADLTACEMVALLRILRPPLERKRAAARQPAPVVDLVRSGRRARRPANRPRTR
jgi:hypothetical protein